MSEFFSYVSAHPYWILIFAVLIALLIIVWYFAIKSSHAHNVERDKTLEFFKREESLRKEFSTISSSTFTCAVSDERLMYGCATNIQKKLEKSSTMQEDFEKLPQQKKIIYSLSYVFEDGSKALSDFFHMNGQPVLKYAENAMKEILGDEASEIFSKEYKMFDEDNENISYNKAEVERLDKSFADLLEKNKKEIFSRIAGYIRENKTVFIEA